jgi:AcrR family transcriptional regulator
MRATLIETAARILAADGPNALSTRRLAAEVGTSTMAVYTHFGSMDQLRRAIRAEGFARLAGKLDELPRTDDAVADLTAGGLAYLAGGLASPELYRAMFTDRPPVGDDNAGAGTFERLVDDVTRCITDGRFHPADPSLARAWAGEIWTMRHGMVTLALTGLLPLQQVRFLLTDMTYRLAVGYGDAPSVADRSVHNGMRDRPQVRSSAWVDEPIEADGGIAKGRDGTDDEQIGDRDGLGAEQVAQERQVHGGELQQ